MNETEKPGLIKQLISYEKVREILIKHYVHKYILWSSAFHI